MTYTEKTHAAFGGQPIDTADARVLAWLIRRHGLEMTHISRGSHIGAIFSLAEIMATLYTGVLNVNPADPKMEGRDRLILSKGHAGAAVYAALAERGFFDVEEAALGATMVKTEYERMLKEEHRDVLISSCCHSVNLLIQKYFPTLLPFLADTMSPMQAHCADIKKRFPEAKTVFIGPCVAKKDEAEYYEGIVDAVLTFEELSVWLDKEGIQLEGEDKPLDASRARFFPTTGGILKTFAEQLPGYTYVAIDGVENCIAALKDIENGKVHHTFIEMSSCVGSCIGGPIMEKNHRSPIGSYMAISEFAGRQDFDVTQPAKNEIHKQFGAIELRSAIPSDYQISEILRQMGKAKPSDELNCGSCGYNTCREKAIAIYQGKAEISMCLPYLKDKAESFSDTVLKHTPNGIFVLNEELEVQQINEEARKIMNIRSASDVLGEPVVRILDPAPFIKARSTGRGIHEEMVYLAEYERYAEQTIVYDKEYRLLICILRDITTEMDEKRRKEEISRQTVEVADRVVDRQMRIVQEIASLLGETAAETKIALTKLKESIGDE